MGYSIETTTITIFLNESLEPGEAAAIDIQFEAHIFPIDSRTGANEHALWFGGFLPLLVQNGIDTVFVPTVADFNVRISTPAEFMVAAPGDVVITEAGDRRATTFYAPLIRDFAFVIGHNFRHTVVMNEEGVAVRGLLYSEIDDEIKLYALNTLADALAFFSETIGRYPYRSFQIVETGYLNGLAVFPQIVFIDANMLLNMPPEEALFLLIQSTAKQWFSGIIGSDNERHPWQSGALAHYVALLFIYQGDEKGLEAHVRGLEYSAIMILHNLRQLLGAQGFAEFLQVYYNNNYMAIATPRDLFEAAESVHDGYLRDVFSKREYEALYSTPAPSRP